MCHPPWDSNRASLQSDGDLDQPPERGVAVGGDGAPMLEKLSVRRVSRAGHLEFALRQPDAGDAHDVLRQRSGLVGADDRSAAERLTDARRRTRLCARAIRRTPTARAIVVTAGSPSGMAAMARMPPVSNIIQTERPLRMPSSATTAERAIATTASRRPSCSAASRAGSALSARAATSSPMRESSVFARRLGHDHSTPATQDGRSGVSHVGALGQGGGARHRSRVFVTGCSRR